jgi:hypothetical protein
MKSRIPPFSNHIDLGLESHRYIDPMTLVFRGDKAVLADDHNIAKSLDRILRSALSDPIYWHRLQNQDSAEPFVPQQKTQQL